MSYNLLSIASALGYPDPEPFIGGVVDRPFATGTFVYNANAETTVIDLTDPTVWAGDPVAASQLKTSGTQFEASLYVHAVNLEFLDADAISIADPEVIRKVAEGLTFEIEDGATTEVYRCGFSVFGGNPAGILDSDLATLTASGWGYQPNFGHRIGAVVNLRDIKGCAVKATAAATNSLLSANSAVRLQVLGALVSTATADPMSSTGPCQRPLDKVAAGRRQAQAYNVMVGR